MIEFLRQIGIALIAFSVGMNCYIIYKVWKSKRVTIHTKVKSFKTMTNALIWLYINLTVSQLLVAASRYHRLVYNVPLTFLDYLGIPLLISYILFNTYLIKKYIIAALKGTLFDKKEVSKMHWEPTDDAS